MSNAPDPLFRREGRSPWWAIGLLFSLYFLTRVSSLNVLPMFLDEAVHIQWAERLFGEGRILKPVGSGRLLAVVAYGAAQPFADRLWAARLIAGLVGALTLLAIVLLARRLFGARAGLVAGLLYVFSPFALAYDRLALSDGFLSASIAGMMLSTWLLVHQRPMGIPLTAVCVSLAVTSKVSALLFLVSVPLAVLTQSKNRGPSIWALSFALAIGLLCASPMLWFFAASSGEISSQHIVDPAKFLSSSASTLGDMRGWVIAYFAWPILLTAVVSLVLIRDGRALWLAASAAFPFLFFALFSQPWSARYVLPTLPPLLILVAGGIDAVAERAKALAAGAALGLTVLASAYGLSFDRHLLFEPALAPFPEDDRLQLVTGWPSGYGIRELSVRLRREATLGPITAYVDSGGLRTVPASLAILLGRDASISIREGDFRSGAFRAAMISEAQNHRAFAIVGPGSEPVDVGAPEWKAAGLERLEEYRRPGGEWAATLFRFGIHP